MTTTDLHGLDEAIARALAGEIEEKYGRWAMVYAAPAYFGWGVRVDCGLHPVAGRTRRCRRHCHLSLTPDRVYCGVLNHQCTVQPDFPDYDGYDYADPELVDRVLAHVGRALESE